MNGFQYCQREIEGAEFCTTQCEHCKEYYQPLEKKEESRNCICCGVEIISIHGGGGDKPWVGMWKSGTVDKINSNYGSNFDGSNFIISICDECIKSKLEDGIIEQLINFI